MTKQPNSKTSLSQDFNSNSSSHHSKPSSNNPSSTSKENPSVPQQTDPVDEAIEESFPASDPPAYSAGTATPAKPANKEKT